MDAIFRVLRETISNTIEESAQELRRLEVDRYQILAAENAKLIQINYKLTAENKKLLENEHILSARLSKCIREHLCQNGSDSILFIIYNYFCVFAN